MSLAELWPLLQLVYCGSHIGCQLSFLMANKVTPLVSLVGGP